MAESKVALWVVVSADVMVVNLVVALVVLMAAWKAACWVVVMVAWKVDQMVWRDCWLAVSRAASKDA